MADKTLKTIIKVRRDTTANWTERGSVLADGELGYDTDAGALKVGDGRTAYENLKAIGGASASHYEGTREGGESDNDVITRVLGAEEATAQKDDIFIVKTLISDEKYSYTAYVYNGSAWVAMDGNYNAENVYFDEDLTTTVAVGNITLSNGQATIPSEGKNLKEVWNALYVAEKNPTTTQPSVDITFSQAKAYEVGTKVTPQYTAKFNAGSYSYGPATGVTVTTWEITDSAQHSSDSESGSFDQLTVEDNTNYTITAKANYGDGAVPKTNLGNDYAAGQIKAGSATRTSGAIKGYRNTFYGTVESKDAEVDSAAIRALTGKSNAALANGSKFNVTIPVGAQRVIIAYPGTLREVNSILDVNGLNAEIKSGFSSTTVEVEGAEGASAISYKVYTLDFAKPNDTANTYAVTI